MFSKDQKFRMPAAYVKVFLQHAAARGIPVQALLRDTGLDPDALWASDETIGLEETLEVLSRADRLLGKGWHLDLGPRLTIPAHGPLGFAVVTAPKLRASVDALLRFISIRGPFLWLAGDQEEDDYVIRLYESVPLGEPRQALMELAILSLQVLLERPLGRELRGARLTFANPPPAYRERLEAVFHTEVRYGARRHSLRFPAAWLEEPCILYDEAMHRYLLARCEEEMQAALGVLPAEIAVRQALLARSDRLPGLKEIAAGQHVSPRTLIRRLKRGNTSYQAIRDDIRRTLAVDYLRNSRMTVAAIAWRLGYQDPSNFGRAFRSWFGQPPGRYRSRFRGRS
jgi:AraC-like DNA-binding protein